VDLLTLIGEVDETPSSRLTRSFPRCHGFVHRPTFPCRQGKTRFGAGKYTVSVKTESHIKGLDAI
jgi:hypothetical protein